MEDQKFDGGPAFPQPCTENGYAANSPYQMAGGGISMRDYFAAKAMQGMMAVPDDQRYGDRADQSLSVEEWQAWCVSGLVEHAYRVADAMLKVRNA